MSRAPGPPSKHAVPLVVSWRLRRCRSKFPTWGPKGGVIRGFLPTDCGQNPPIRNSRWGIPRACGAKSRKSSNGEDFRVFQSLHISAYRKLGRLDYAGSA